jgi:hypothetical protein
VGISAQFLFFVMSFSGLGMRVMAASSNEFGSILFTFLEDFEKDCLVKFTYEII